MTSEIGAKVYIKDTISCVYVHESALYIFVYSLKTRIKLLIEIDQYDKKNKK